MSRGRRIVIVGSGMAAARLVEHLLARSSAEPFDIVVFGDEPGGTYNRILLPGVLSGTHAGPDIVTNPLDWYHSNGVTLHAGLRVTGLDVRERHVVDQRGTRHPFDTLVLATGSRPVVPAIAGLISRNGSMVSGAFVFRTVDDCARIAVAASAARRAAVIGGGLLGLEAARGLTAYDAEVTVVHLATHLMETQLDPQAGLVLQRQVEAMGVRVLTGTTTTRALGDTAVEGLAFADGSHLECDLLVVAAGVRPEVELARAAGLRVNRGIVVGDDLACPGTDGIYALGDCAEHDGRAYGLIAPAWEQADVLADRLTGRRADAAYRGSRVATKLKVAGLDLAVMGDRDARDGDDVVSYSELSRGIYARVIVRDDRVAGAILIGTPAPVPSLVQRFLDDASVPVRRSDLLFPPGSDAAVVPAEQLPDSARICDCNAVVKEQIVDAVLNGARSLRAVCDRTRAGTGCGSCRPEVQRIVDFACRSLADPLAPPIEENRAST